MIISQLFICVSEKINSISDFLSTLNPLIFKLFYRLLFLLNFSLLKYSQIPKFLSKTQLDIHYYESVIGVCFSVHWSVFDYWSNYLINGKTYDNKVSQGFCL